jgi:hypothetical protein
MWKVFPKTPHTQFLCRFQFYKLPLKTNRGQFEKGKFDGFRDTVNFLGDTQFGNH